jgi:hypothetical protein
VPYDPGVRRTAPRALAAAAFAGALLSTLPARAAGFFDDVPRKGYIKDDVSMDVLDAGAGNSVVARVRYLRLALDPGRRDLAYDSWPEREMLLVERATGERVAFERLSRLPEPRDASAPRPQGRIGLDGTAVEILARPGVPGDPCGALDLVVHAGNLELPVAAGDLDARTVRLGIAQTVETAFGPRERELVARTVPVLVAAQSQGVPSAPLDVLKILFPGQPFARAAQGLSFRPAAGAPLNPGDGAWRSVTDAPEMLPGVPVF